MHVHHVHATWSMGPSVEPMLWTSNRKHILYARDTHLTTCAQLIEVLSHANMPRRLAAARTAFAAAFPLSEPLWAAWLEAAVGQVASGDMDAEELLRLAQRATQDYLSCNLWQTYLSCAPAVGAEFFMCSCALRCYAMLCYAVRACHGRLAASHKHDRRVLAGQQEAASAHVHATHARALSLGASSVLPTHV